MQIKKQQAERVLKKFGLKRKTTHHLMYSFLHPDTGSFVLGTRVSFGRGELRTPDKFRRDLEVSEEQMRGAIQCSPFKFEDWLEVLQEKGII